MTRGLKTRGCGPGLTIQDLGRPGYLEYGLSRGGAVDRLAVFEGAALLGQSAELAVLEMPGAGGTFEATADLRIALTGAPMRALIDGAMLAWNASHKLPRGATLSIGGVLAGSYGYLHVGGGFDTPMKLGSRATHLLCGIGRTIRSGDDLAVGPERNSDDIGLCLDPAPRLKGGKIRIVPTPQTALFSRDERGRFEAMEFRRDARGNRMGVRLLPDGNGFGTEAGLSILSETVVTGDIQITGDGSPFVLLSECQTTGGYPRIGTVLPTDLPRVAQGGTGTTFRFTFVTVDEATQIEALERKRLASLRTTTRRLVRRPEDMHDLLFHQLIGGATAGDDLDRND